MEQDETTLALLASKRDGLRRWTSYSSVSCEPRSSVAKFEIDEPARQRSATALRRTFLRVVPFPNIDSCAGGMANSSALTRGSNDGDADRACRSHKYRTCSHGHCASPVALLSRSFN